MTKIHRDMEHLTPSFRKKVEAFMEEVQPMGVFITESWRDVPRQQDLFSRGLSFLDGVQRKSMHQLGKAIDIGFKDDPRTGEEELELYPKDQKRWREVADIAKKYGLDWGYDLWKWDKPHFQDDGTEYADPTISPWAKDSVEKAIKNNVATDWRNPQQIIASATAEWILQKAGILGEVTGKGVTKERFIVALDRLGAL